MFKDFHICRKNSNAIFTNGRLVFDKEKPKDVQSEKPDKKYDWEEIRKSYNETINMADFMIAHLQEKVMPDLEAKKAKAKNSEETQFYTQQLELARVRINVLEESREQLFFVLNPTVAVFVPGRHITQKDADLSVVRVLYTAKKYGFDQTKIAEENMKKPPRGLPFTEWRP